MILITFQDYMVTFSRSRDIIQLMLPFIIIRIRYIIKLGNRKNPKVAFYVTGLLFFLN